MDAASFSNLAELVRRRAGITLSADKVSSITRRLGAVAQVFGFKDGTSLMAELAHPHEELAQAVAESMTTQDTWFFRDESVFAHFQEHALPAAMQLRRDVKRLRIWSAGCSTGQEAYSLAMILDETGFFSQGWIADIIATDFNSAAIARARAGLYSQYETERGLSHARRARHFNQEGGMWRINERLRRAITFRVFNLLDHFGWLAQLDIIFCRNVLIYLAPEEKAAILAKMYEALAPDGLLYLGASEGNGLGARPFEPAPGPRGLFQHP